MAAGGQSVTKIFSRLTLMESIEPIQNVPATDQIDLRERRVAGHVLVRENAVLAKSAADLIARQSGRKIRRQEFRRHIPRDVLRINSRPGLTQRGIIEIRTKNRDGNRDRS